MNPDIASLDEPMWQGGDWNEFWDEIAGLYPNAVTEDGERKAVFATKHAVRGAV